MPFWELMKADGINPEELFAMRFSNARVFLLKAPAASGKISFY
ncbi:Uncharacterised protein [Salmonella enterica subsp. enterica]|uniref:Uncharacterized protein n=1 Tax=Salmonella enterica I TaxID=59201 RepID=A0A447N563_SALET|nr:Uncharacterised protein [Salmonella enterica subsp. enterica]